ncbi:MAG: zinc finger HIT domain-containing protein [Halorubrum sp.]
MSVTGLCQICEAAPARYACPRCGRAVCEDHWNDGVGACTACVQGRQQ